MTVVLQRPERQDDGVNERVSTRCSSSAAVTAAAFAHSRRTPATADWLTAMQRSTVEGAVSRNGGPFSVVLYALTTAGKEPTATLERVRAYAAAQGWRVADAVFDDCGMTDPNERAGWTKALGLLRSAHAQGVVTVDRSAVSTNDPEYEQALRWLQDHRSFLEHVPLGWRPAIRT
jgi:hypothetical protein